ncbi:hypothetical protein D9M71_675840 [compost metagenome]
MRVGMAGGEARQAFARHLAGRCRLAVAGHRVVLAVGGQHRTLAIPEGGAEGRRHAAAALLHLEAFLAQQFDVPGAGLVLAEGRLGVMPDHLVPVRQRLALVLHPVEGELLGLVHERDSLWGNDSRPRRGQERAGLSIVEWSDTTIDLFRH